MFHQLFWKCITFMADVTKPLAIPGAKRWCEDLGRWVKRVDDFISVKGYLLAPARAVGCVKVCAVPGQVGHHGVPAEDGRAARFPRVERPADPLCWIHPAWWLRAGGPCHPGVHTGTAPATTAAAAALLPGDKPRILMHSGRDVLPHRFKNFLEQ